MTTPEKCRTQEGWVMKEILLSAALLSTALLGLALLGAALSVSVATANPSGQSVRHGNVRFERSGNHLRVLQGSDRAIIDWDNFSIRGGESTRFRQPGSASAVLNRVRGGDISRIDGALRANGNVFLLNPNGIAVGPTGIIDAGGFVGSTLDISDAEFLAGGDLRFRGSSQAAIVNLGTISAAHGDVFLMAATVDNSGFIRAPRGTVGLAAGNDILLKDSGEERVFVRGASGGKKADGVVNRGDIEANIAELKSYGGNVYGMAVRNEGRVAATGVSSEGGQLFLRAGGGKIRSTGTLTAKRPTAKRGGNVVVDAGRGGAAEIGGRVDASGDDGVGGSVVLLGDNIEVFDNALILADGGAGGGRIYIGGGREGQDVRFSNATSVSVGNGAEIDASAGNAGDGGEVIVFASGDLNFQGMASARGGTTGGDGGFVELSGKENVRIASLLNSVDVTAASGSGGTFLLDPNDILILPFYEESSGITGSPAQDNTLYDQDIADFLDGGASGQNLLIKTDAFATGGEGDITVSIGSYISWSSDANLSFEAVRNFRMESDTVISNSMGGGVSITAGNEIAIDGYNVEVPGNASIQTVDGNIVMENTGSYSSMPLVPVGDGVFIRYANLSSVNGDIGITGNGDMGAGIYVGDSTVATTGLGNVTIDGRGGGGTGMSPGVDLAYSTISTNQGILKIKGQGGSNSDGIVMSGAVVQTFLGGIEIEGNAGDGNTVNSGDAVGVTASSATNFYGYSGATIAIAGKGSGVGDAIQIGADAQYSGVFGDGTQKVFFTTLGGDVNAEGVFADELTLKGAGNAPGDFDLSGEVSHLMTEGPVGDITMDNNFSDIALGNIDSTGTIDIKAGLYISIQGTINAGTQISLTGSGFPSSAFPGGVETVTGIYYGYEESLFAFEEGSSLSAPDIHIDGGEFGGNLDVYGSLDLTNYRFTDIYEGRGVGSSAMLRTSAAGEDVLIEGYVPFGSGSEYPIDGATLNVEVPIYGAMGAALIDGVYFFGFDTISGGGSADTFTIDLSAGETFIGNLSSGGGNDTVYVLPGGGEVAGLFSGGGGTDTLSYENFTTGITVAYGAGGFPGLSQAESFERVIGSAGEDTLQGTAQADTFRITSNNAGEINGGQFESFEILDGLGGNDRFKFLNQGVVTSVAGGNGSDLLWIDDNNLTGSHTYKISEGLVSRNPTYQFGGIEVLQLTLGGGDDTVVTGPFSFAQVLDAAGGNDTLVLPGGRLLDSNPIVFSGGQPITHFNFENPLPGGNPPGGGGNPGGGPIVITPATPDPGILLTDQVGSGANQDPPMTGDQTSFSDTPGPVGGVEALQNSLFPGVAGAFSAVVAGQAAVVLLDGDAIMFAPASLDGTFSQPPVIVIAGLKRNSGIDVFAELSAAIGYDGPALLIYSDGPYAINLSGPPEAVIARLLTQLLDPEAAGELYSALEMAIAMPITSEDGVVSILTLPVQPGAATIAMLTEILNNASFNELAAALDG